MAKISSQKSKTAGEYGDQCYRAACRNEPAIYLNFSTRKYYCKECARLLNNVNREDAMRLYSHDLCLEKRKCDFCESEFISNGRCPECENRKIIKTMKRKRVNSWTPIKGNNPLPPEGQYVLCYVENRGFSPTNVVISQYTKYGFESATNTSHWMPLPESPKQ